MAEYSRLEQDGLFQWHFGKDCVDEGYIPGRSAGTDPGAYVKLNLGRDLWPFEEKLPELDEEWVFTIIEFLYDHAAKPTRVWHHNFAGCGMHVNEVDEPLGHRALRDSANRYLPRYGSGFELQENGEIWQRAPSGLEFLAPIATGEPSIDDKVQHAIATFRNRTATDQQKRDSINNLADILEFLRASDGTKIPSEEESRLFEIANNFGVRHHNPSQKVDYDPEVWLDWMFYTFLNAVALATAHLARDSGASTEAQEGEDDLPFS